MATIKSFEDIEVWQRARAFSLKIYDLTQEGSFAKDYSLRNQINDASGSVMDNIAEGFERGGNKEFINFLSYAKGSAGETRSQLYRAVDRKHITEETFVNLKTEALAISKMISGFMSYLQTSSIRGSKFLEPFEGYGNHPISDTDLSETN
ncbi:four helix bundle protein [Fulvivirgaceae bacterium PWU4]|uniref:Four helix bundle protein n=1 Tax=Chryseosolibacter histidini TaxID=2782349 RepID=A0AAP2DQA3_9BACT|nr:four helix bundle protein [Chryseosolibacter histidini]MBT1700546.1 four helix bundle protein [Chryseosolibacter histidini]